MQTEQVTFDKPSCPKVFDQFRYRLILEKYYGKYTTAPIGSDIAPRFSREEENTIVGYSSHRKWDLQDFINAVEQEYGTKLKIENVLRCHVGGRKGQEYSGYWTTFGLLRDLSEITEDEVNQYYKDHYLTEVNQAKEDAALLRGKQIINPSDIFTREILVRESPRLRLWGSESPQIVLDTTEFNYIFSTLVLEKMGYPDLFTDDKSKPIPYMKPLVQPGYIEHITPIDYTGFVMIGGLDVPYFISQIQQEFGETIDEKNVFHCLGSICGLRSFLIVGTCFNLADIKEDDVISHTLKTRTNPYYGVKYTRYIDALVRELGEVVA
jgi:hypothetical protein